MMAILILIIGSILATAIFLAYRIFMQEFKGSVTMKTSILKIFQFEFKISRKK